MTWSIDWAREKNTARGRVFFMLSAMEWRTHISLAKVGGPRFSARILELKRLGYDIESRPIDGEKTNGNEYRLLSLVAGTPQGKRVKVYLEESHVEALLGSPPHFHPGARAAMQDALGSFKTNKHKL